MVLVPRWFFCAVPNGTPQKLAYVISHALIIRDFYLLVVTSNTVITQYIPSLEFRVMNPVWLYEGSTENNDWTRLSNRNQTRSEFSVLEVHQLHKSGMFSLPSFITQVEIW